MADDIKPVSEPVEPEYTFPDHAVTPQPVSFPTEASKRPKAPGWATVVVIIGVVLGAEAVAYAWTHGYVPSVPQISWPDRREAPAPPTAQESVKIVDVQARLIENVSEYIRTTRQIAFEGAKATPNATEVAALSKRRDELKIEILADAAKIPKDQLPPEVARFVIGVK